MNTLKKAEEFVIAISLLGATLLLFVNIVLRNVFSSNPTWAEELIRYVMIWTTFIGASVCFRKGMHVGVDFLLELSKGIYKKGLILFVNLASMSLMLFLIKYGWDLVLFTKQTNQITPSLQIPLYYIYLAIPVGSLLSLIHLVIQTIQIVLKKVDIEEHLLNNLEE
ncbi:TRAP transporter small permease [Bacillaceae bacterium S4-13-58]